MSHASVEGHPRSRAGTVSGAGSTLSSSTIVMDKEETQLLNGRHDPEEKKQVAAEASPATKGGRGGITRGLIQLVSIGQWWFFNVATVILNKFIFQKLQFEFPLSLSTIHFIVSSIGAYIFLHILKLRPLVDVKPADRWSRVFPMACVFCINIVLGNISLSSIPVSFMQTVKSLTPATTVLLQRFVWGRMFDSRIYLSLLPVVGGIVVTSVTELSFVWKGFLAAMAGCFVTSTKTILAETLLHGKYSFDSLNTVYHMAPYATMLLILPALVFEGQGLWGWLLAQPSLSYPLSVLLLSGVLAFSLNYSIFYVIQTTSALTFNVAGNMKTAVAISASWFLFRNPMSYLNVLGCAITLAGCTLYGYVRQVLGARAVLDMAKEEHLPVKSTGSTST
eukprot:TRINITY_DN16562_c0_g1_i1.p1 TRINITY_DN16562_c0_g1~~TRINITY_DN16562_c0_g1_i1.p1  ORF type:complete len:392 (+),score=54.27 TRINITY_DN16562_c0_g1_i1:233-1408(+)